MTQPYETNCVSNLWQVGGFLRHCGFFHL